ncbi:MAG: hypothetical protein ACREO4_16300 [Lysobacter sp.]
MVAAGVERIEAGGAMLWAMTPDQTTRLAALDAFVGGYVRTGKTCRQFWDEFWAKAADLQAEASATGPESDLSIALYEIVDSAHEGFSGNPATYDDVME